MFPLMQIEVVQQSLFHIPCFPITFSTNSIKQSLWEANYHWVINFPTFMEPEGPLLYSQETITEPVKSSPHPCILFPSELSYYCFPYMPRSSMWPLPFRYADQNLNAFLITPMCLAHLILDWITIIISGEEYTLRYLISFIKKTTTIEHDPLGRILSSYKHDHVGKQYFKGSWRVRIWNLLNWLKIVTTGFF